MKRNLVLSLLFTLMLPLAFAQETTTPETATPEVVTEAIPSGTIAAILSTDERFGTLLTALQTAGMLETLNGEGFFTVFAPTNDAFALLPEDQLSALLSDPVALADVLNYHVIAGEYSSIDVASALELPTVQGGTLAVGTDANSKVMINEAAVLEPDLVTSNGVIHVIDTVLVPAAE